MRVIFLLSCLISVSCATTQGQSNTVLNRAEFDLNCPKNKIQIVKLGAAYGSSQATFGASGCEKRATYIVNGDPINGYTAILNSAKLENSH